MCGLPSNISARALQSRQVAFAGSMLSLQTLAHKQVKAIFCSSLLTKHEKLAATPYTSEDSAPAIRTHHAPPAYAIARPSDFIFCTGLCCFCC